MTDEKNKKGDGSIEPMEYQDDENQERGNWTGKLDFLLSCLGYAVGLGNVWRFPYLCYKHGGGAFLIPYTIMLIFIGVPCFFMEISIGQFAALGPVTIYSNMAPLFKGLGFANFMASSFVGIYYNMIIAWTIYYLFASFTSHLPWSDCNNEFNSECELFTVCFSITDYKNCLELRDNSTENSDAIYHMGRCLSNDDDLAKIRDNLTHFYGCTFEEKFYNNPLDKTDGVNYTLPKPGIYLNSTDCVEAGRENEIQSLFDIPNSKRRTAAQEYFQKSVLVQSNGIEEMGSIQWHLALCLLAAWIVIFCCLIKGIKSSGKVVYFTATFPYFVLFILLGRALFLEGAIDGIRFYIIPDFDRLSDISVWSAAAVQIFFSLSVAGGGLITLASYNPFHNNVVRDTVIVCLGNCLTSFIAGFAIFSVLGFLAHELGVDVQDVVQDGTGLAFIAYPDLVTRIVGAPFWSFLFFAMLFTLGLDSQFAIVETILTGILDFAPQWRGKKTLIVGIVCIVGFFCGLPLTCEGGGYVLDFLDFYAAGWPYLFIGLTELILVCYVYGIENFMDDLYNICGFNPGLWCKTIFMFVYLIISPLLILVILIVDWSQYTPLTKDEYVYPWAANAFGFVIAFISILAVPIVAVYLYGSTLFENSKNHQMSDALKRTNAELLRPTAEWRKNADRAKRQDARNGNNESGFEGRDNPGLVTD
ncbi:hypothetical protein TCAL_03333 [Tigriopus californicus]|uniref:Transporter n=1 Tax=Tigriopus californicus TaxID=6832 RepID=A0A553P759_TIGCA|nr:hypothetical protein TCAL_03333 [Tigriopus californicus]